MGWSRSCRKGSSLPQPVLVASPSPLAMGLGKAEQLGTHYGGWAHIISALLVASVHGQDLSSSSFLLVPLKCHYRNQNSRRAAKLFPFGCAPDQTSSKNLSRALSTYQRAPSSRPAPLPGPACSREPVGTQEGQLVGKWQWVSARQPAALVHA